MLFKETLYSIGPVLLHKLPLYSKCLLAMLDVLRIYGIEGTFSQRKIVDAVQERSFTCAVRAYDKVQLVCEIQLNGGVVF